jgi:hypothetical protein
MRPARYLTPGTAARALMWMTASEQCLGWLQRDGVRRIRWVRLDWAAGVPGVLVSVHEDDLVGSLRTLRRLGVPELDPAADLPPDLVVAGEEEAVLAAERERGARPDRWVNKAVEGWALLCELRGHE